MSVPIFLAYETWFMLTYYTTLILSALGFLSGIYALWYDGKHRHRLKNCATEYAALVLSTTCCLAFIVLVSEWYTSPSADKITHEENLSWMIYHIADKMAIWLFHVVLVTRVLRVRAEDERNPKGS